MDWGSNTYTYTVERWNSSQIYTAKVIVKDKAGNTSDRSITQSNIYLVEQVSVGDYVAYDAGTWTSGSRSGIGWSSASNSTPSSNAMFGSYIAGTNKGTSVSTNGSAVAIAPTSGWRVLSKTDSGSSGSVTLISAGCPAEGYYYASSSNQPLMIVALNNFSNENFVDGVYGASARSATKEDMDVLEETEEIRLERSVY